MPLQTPGPAVSGRLATRLLDLALPATCPGCGAEGEVLCASCRRALEVRRGLPPGTPIGLASLIPIPVVQVEWCAPFCGVVRTALHRLKYSGERRLAGPLGEAMAGRWREAGAGGDLLVPVPVHPKRARQRGYDQAVLLAASAARALGLPMRPALARIRHTVPQFELGRHARLGNVRSAFALSEEIGRSAVAGSWIVLVDDVVTTGSTLAACATALYGAGAAVVSALTVARER